MRAPLYCKLRRRPGTRNQIHDVPFSQLAIYRRKASQLVSKTCRLLQRLPESGVDDNADRIPSPTARVSASLRRESTVTHNTVGYTHGIGIIPYRGIQLPATYVMYVPRRATVIIHWSCVAVENVRRYTIIRHIAGRKRPYFHNTRQRCLSIAPFILLPHTRAHISIYFPLNNDKVVDGFE